MATPRGGAPPRRGTGIVPPTTSRRAPIAPLRGTTKRLTRAGRERRIRQFLVGAFIVVVLTIVAVPALGYYREVLTKGSQTIAHVRGDPIRLDDFAKVYGFRLAGVDAQLSQMQQFASQQPPKGANDPPDQMLQQLNQLREQRGSLDTTVVNEMIEQVLIAREAKSREIMVTAAEEDAYIDREFAIKPTPTPVVDPDASPTPAIDVTPAATLTANARLQSILAAIKVMNEADYRALVAQPTLLSERLQDRLFEEAPKTESQMHARHILVKTEEEAKAVKERIDKGEAFEKVAAEVSIDESNKGKGGDLDWFGSGAMVKPFEDALTTLKPGEISNPILTKFGYHIVQLIERDDARPIADARKTELRNKVFKEWLEKQTNDGFASKAITYEYDGDKVTWAKSYVAKARGIARRG